jgi:hypothetical protein
MPPPDDLRKLQAQYREDSKKMQDTAERIIYKQYFALQNKLNTSLLVSQGKPTPTH